MLWVGALVVYVGRSAAFLSGLKGSFGESYGTSSLGHRRTRGYPMRAGALMALLGRFAARVLAATSVEGCGG
ncbi:hypothetical protein B296_00019257 [Ensete ventricosum]|uniref:Uncharacterized protein n=1 Tax=Ensete ventricosum TaxID=4639 RepID=A0A427AIY3_ENSVE|nr:hypothetical protein B296_00019257 [Ensete ventricosum]